MRTIQSWVRDGFSAATALALVGCAAVVPFVGGPPPTMTPPGAALCPNSTVKPVAQKMAGAARDSVTVDGQKLVFPGGENPAGGGPFRIAEPVAGYVVVQVGPSRHRFASERGQLTISYDRCPQNVTGPFAIYRWNDADDRWDKLQNSRPVPGRRAVTVPLDSLSEYALGAG